MHIKPPSIKSKHCFSVFFSLFITSVTCAQDKPVMAALNRVTLNYSDTVYQFYAEKVPKKIKFRADKSYHWYVKDTILITQYGYDGKLLNGKFNIFYPNKNLMEQGQFKYGLKTGLWKSWHPSGLLKQTVNWADGLRHGSFEEFDPSGRKIRSGTYKNNLFTGQIIIYLQGGTPQQVYYKDGKIVVEEPNAEKSKKPADRQL